MKKPIFRKHYTKGITMINVDDRLLGEVDEQVFYLLCCVAKFMREGNFSFPSNSTLCKITKWEVKKLRRVKQKAVAAGFLEVIERHHETGGRTSDGYRILTDKISVFVNLKGKGIPHPQNGEYPPTQVREGVGTQNGEYPPTQVGEDKEVLTKEVLTTEQSHTQKENAERKLPTSYEPAYNNLIEHLKANAFLIDGLKRKSGFSGPVAPIIRAYLRKVQENGEWFQLMIPEKSEDYQRWVSKILAGVEGWAEVRKNRKQPAPNQTGTTYTPPAKVYQPIR